MSVEQDSILIEGKLYDVHKLAADHPGGSMRVYLHAQSDATIAFRTYHRRPFPHEKYKSYLLKNQEHDIHETKPSFKNYDELCERVKPLLESSKGFAPTWYYAKVAVLVGFAIALELHMLRNGRTWLGSFVWGMLGAWIGLNVQHDANHGSVSRSPVINRLFGLTQDYLGGSAMGWMIEHNAIHHIYTNDAQLDYDLRLPMFRLHKSFPWMPIHVFQHWTLLIGEASFGIFHVMWNLVEWLHGPQGRFKFMKPWWNTHGLLFLITVFRIFYPIYQWPSWATVGQIVTGYCVGGLYLAFFFVMSHNFAGVNKELHADQGDFMANQVTTSSNVGGPLLAFFNGGLNYQIEHHLFPRVHHSHYATLAPVVRKFCEEKKVNYVHFPTIMDNFVSTLKHLKELGRAP